MKLLWKYKRTLTIIYTIGFILGNVLIYFEDFDTPIASWSITALFNFIVVMFFYQSYSEAKEKDIWDTRI